MCDFYTIMITQKKIYKVILVVINAIYPTDTFLDMDKNL